MNERIKELIKQAHERKPVIVADPVTFEPIHKIGNYNEPMYHNVFSPEKFAELIVRECISKCEFVADMATITNKGEMARKTKATADSCAKMIKEHFGV